MKSDIRKLDLNLLKALDALLDERSVTRAADRLALTQPAVTGMLNRLRESFDDPLFVRAQRGIVPTLRAEQLAMPVKQLLADVEGMLQPQAFDPLTANMIVKLARLCVASNRSSFPKRAEAASSEHSGFSSSD